MTQSLHAKSRCAIATTGRGSPQALLPRCIALGLMLVLLSAPLAYCQETGFTALRPSDGMLKRLRNVQFHVSQGRLIGSSAALGDVNSGGSGTINGRSESFSHRYSEQPGKTNMQYSQCGPDGTFTVSVVDAHQFKIDLATSGNDAELHFFQRPQLPLSLQLTLKQETQTYSAPSLWHLYFAAPDVMDSYLFPVLEVLNPTWGLSAQCSAVEEALFRQAQQRPKDDNRTQWARWVEELGSETFATRSSAVRQLQSVGQPIVPYLENLDRSKLDREQQAQVRELIEKLSQGYDDTPDAIAVWLFDDEAIWLSLLDDESLERRKLATAQLGRLRGTDIDYDPAADAAKRKSQIDKLKGKRG